MGKPTHDEILLRIIEYLRQNIEKPLPESITESTRLVAELQLDSLEGLQLLSELEDQYEVKIAAQVLRRLETLGDVVNVVDEALDAVARTP